MSEEVDVTFRLDGNPGVIYLGTDKTAYRLDLEKPDALVGREAVIARAVLAHSLGALGGGS